MPSSKAAEIFRKNVRAAMDDAGVTITELARRIGTSQQGMSRVLAGHDGVTLDRAQRIADKLGVPLKDLLDPSKKESRAAARA